MEPSKSAGSAQVLKLPFEQLPNLPKPIVPDLNLNIDNINLAPSLGILGSKRRIGYYLRDKSCQTNESEILDLKRVTTAMQTLNKDVLLLRKDLSYAQNVMKADYQAKITERATTLYCRMNKRLKELENDHRDKLSRLRNSYRTQLSDAVKKISGEYKAYYEELLSGKTDRHDIIIKQLKEQASELSRYLEEKESELELAQFQLKQSRMQLQSEEEKPTVVSPSSPTGVSSEKHMELLEAMNLLQEELRDLQVNASHNEATIRKLKKDNEVLNKQLFKEKEKVAQIQNDYDNYKKRAVDEHSQANKLAMNQMAVLEKQMKEQMIKEKEKALMEVQQKADKEKMESEARHLQELSARKALEEKMAKEINSLSEQESLAVIQKLQKVEARQKKQIERLEHDLEKTNKAWEMKLTIMQRNFHALKDEAFIRHSLQRQAAALHHATVGYTVQGTTGNEKRIHSNFPKPKPLVRYQDMDPGGGGVTQGSRSHSGRNSSSVTTANTTGLQSLSSVLIPPAPSPSPNHVQWRQERIKTSPKADPVKSRAVQFDINSPNDSPND